MPSPNVSGIQTLTSGERHIPQSTRSDGSIRKEIKVRPGYRPPEDVEKYKNRTVDGWQSRATMGPPGSESLKDYEAKPTGNQGKNARRREARKKARASGSEDTRQDGFPNASIAQNVLKESNSQDVESVCEHSLESTQLPEEESLEAPQERVARNLKKRLRQAKDLQNKKESGASLLPEQVAKVIKISELIRQLDTLGFDSNGDPKPGDNIC